VRHTYAYRLVEAAFPNVDRTAMSSDRHARHFAIRALVGSCELSSQTDVVEALHDQHGIKAHQSTVSRDLAELGIVLMVVEDSDGGHRVAYRLPDVMTADASQRLVVVAPSATRAATIAGRLGTDAAPLRENRASSVRKVS
jgi:arginine repressor